MSKRRKNKKDKSIVKSIDNAQSSGSYKHLGIALLVTVVVFFNSLQNGFVNWDDPANFLDNPWIANPENLGLIDRIIGIFTSDVLGNYNPLSNLSFMIDKAIFGFENPMGWHLINLLLHLLVVSLVFKLLARLGFNNHLAMIGAIIFAVHPMHVESVSWVTERKDVLFSAFYFGALIQYLSYRKSKSVRTLVSIYLLFILALLSKIQAVSLPLSMVLIDYYKSGRLDIKPIIAKWGFFLLSLITGVAGILFLKDEGSLSVAGETFGMIETIVFGSWSLLVYLYKFIIPYPLSSYYPYPESLSILHYASLLLIPLLAWLALKTYRQSNKTVFFGMGFFLVNIIFVLQVVQAGQGFLADRFSYVPYFGLIFILVHYYNVSLSSYASRKKLIHALMLFFVIGLSVLAIRQNKVWKNGETLWGNVIDNYPDKMRPYAARGNYHYRNRNFAQAIKDFTMALERKENDEIYANRAKSYMQSGNPTVNYPLAITDLHKAVQLNPKNPENYINRGVIYVQSSMFDQALIEFTQAINLKTDRNEAYLNRGKIYKFQGKMAEAVQDFNTYLTKVPNDPNIWYEKAEIELNINQLDQALYSVNQAIKLNNSLCKAYIVRGTIQQKKGDIIARNRNMEKAKELGCLN